MGGKGTENMDLLRTERKKFLPKIKKKIFTRDQNKERPWKRGIVRRLLLQMIWDWNNLYGLYSAIERQDEKFIEL